MMRKAARYHVVRGLLVVVVLALFGWGVYEGHGTLKAHALVDSLLRAETIKVPDIVGDIASYRPWINTLLRKADQDAKAKENARKKLHTSLSLLPVDSSQVHYLTGRLLDAEPGEVPVIREALAPHKVELQGKLWSVVDSPEKGKESQRLRAAAALARYDGESEKWTKASDLVVNDLVQENAVFLGQWSEAFRPIKDRLLPRLSVIFRDHQPERAGEQKLATNLLADYAADQPSVLADLVMDADEKQFAVIYPKFKEQGAGQLSLLTSEIDSKLAPGAKNEAREELARRQANAAVALLRMNEPAKVWQELKHSSDPGARSYLIHRLGPLGADARALVKRLDEEPDLTIRRALLLSLGEFGEKEFSPAERKMVVPKLQDIYRTATDPGMHASAEWLLRTWQQEGWLKQVNEKWAKDKDQREKRLQGIHQLVAKDREKAPPQWYVNGQGQTMVVIPGPVVFDMGSPPQEAGRNNDEAQHRKRIGRSFAISAKSVTKEQFLRFMPAFSHKQMHRYPDPACPIGGVVWHEAAGYCNWLSEKELIEQDKWCYETNLLGQVTKLKANYLGLAGYRLPTEAEWEYACRAGAVTSRYYGETEELLGKYGWYFQNSGERTWPVGSKKPTDLGLFDMHGNIFTWCQEAYKPYRGVEEGKADEDIEDTLSIKNEASRVLRGGTFNDRASHARSADRFYYAPDRRTNNFGFRPARTFR
jgi:eukaryotic-like serine/threonine-protein kinase